MYVVKIKTLIFKYYNGSKIQLKSTHFLKLNEMWYLFAVWHF